MIRLAHIALFLAFTLGACQHEPGEPPLAPTGTLRVIVNPHWDGQPVVDNGVYTDVLGHRLNIDQLNMYIGDIQLGGGGQSTVASRIELFRLINGSRERNYQLPTAEYAGVKFGIGVPADLNNENVNSYAPGSPLFAQQGTHWGMLNYRFVMLDAFADTSGTGAGPFDRSVSLHSGRDENYREVTSPQGVTITEDSVTTLTLDVDVRQFFFSANDTIDVRLENMLHGAASQAFLNERFSDHIQNAVTVPQ